MGPVPALGQHTEAILTELGYGERREGDRRRYVIAGSVPKKTLQAARAR